MQFLYKNNKGFTLIELLVVIAIIGILAGIIIPNLNSAKQSGRDAKRISDIKNIQLALALYYNDQSPPKYPSTLSALVAAGYLSAIPKNPSNPSDSSYPYYSALAPGSGIPSCNGATYYHLGVKLETTNSILADDASLDANSLNGQSTIGGVTYSACNGSGANFKGESSDCSLTSSLSDGCYDVVPN
jgi:general secretion pathway protein G